MPEYLLVTTFNGSGYEQYGRKMLDSFLAHWPDTQRILVYIEGATLDTNHMNNNRIMVRNLNHVEKLTEFKARHRDNPPANGFHPVGSTIRNYRFDAVRFSHKVFALWHAQANMPTGASSMVWLDADTLTHSDVPEDFLARIAPETFNKTGIGGPYGISYLGRSRYYTECGFVSYNLRHPSMGSFWEMFVGLYNNDGLFTLQEWHDSFIFDHCRRIFEGRGMINHNITPRIIKGHPFINCDLGLYMDHLKGARKQRGRSEKNERTVRSLVKADYWS
jgi:hypothetical protein